MISLLLNCYNTKNITEKKKKSIGILGQYELLMKELSDEDVPVFLNFVRVELEPRMFQCLPDWVLE